MEGKQQTVQPRVGTGVKAGFGLAEIGLTSMELLLQVYLLELYVVSGLSPTLAGLALGLAVLWDAVSDPLMGSISDRTRAGSARGKRFPYIVAGALVCGVAISRLFDPAGGATQGELFVHLLLWYLALNTALTLIGVPYLALVNDLAHRSEDRGGFFGWRLVFSGAGLIVGLAVPSALAGWSDATLSGMDLASNRSAAADWIGGGAAFFCVATLAALWGPAGRAKPDGRYAEGLRLGEVLRFAGRSPRFWLIVGAFVSVSVGRAFNSSLALLFYKGTLKLGDAQVAGALIALSVTIMAATPFWVLASKRWAKGPLCVWGIGLLTALTATVYPLMPVGRMEWVYFIAVAGGVAAASVVLLESLFSDVVESDGERIGQPLTGSYYGLWRMAMKVARALGLAVSGLFLAGMGFEEGKAEQTLAVERGVAWAFGPGVAVFFAGGGLLVWALSRRLRLEGGSGA